MKKKYEQTRFDKQAQERIKFVIDTYFGGSQQELAEKCNIHKASVSQYVNGKNVPSNLTAEKICNPLKLNPAWLMGFDVPMRDDFPIGMPPAQIAEITRFTDLSVLYNKLSDANRQKLVFYAEKLYDIQQAEDELK